MRPGTIRGKVALPAAVAVLLTAGLLAAPPALAHVKQFGGIIRDVPTGTRTSVPVRAVLASAASGGRLPYGGGRVLHSNRTHAIFWAPSGSGLTFDPGYEALIEMFLIDVAADSHKSTNVYGLSGQYGDASGPAAYDSTYGGAVEATDPLPPNVCTEPAVSGPGWSVCLTDDQLEAEIQRVISADHLPTTNRDVYFLITPNGLGSCTDVGSSSCALGGIESGYCGYHSETSDGVVYAVIPYNAVPGHCQSNNPRPNSNTADPTISTISHEHNEMITDPDGYAWIDGQGNENGDLCLTNFGSALSAPGVSAWNENVHGGHFFLQEEWSNADLSCQARAKSDALSFATIRLAGHARAISFAARGADPEGRILSFEWFFGDGRVAFGRHVSHTFRSPGTYHVVVRSTDSWANWAFSAHTVHVRAR